MNNTRSLIACTLSALILLGPLVPAARAQQPAPAPAPQPRPAAQPVLMPDVVKEDSAARRPFDAYSVGAGVLTAARIPFNIGLCALGSAVGTTLFLLTLGSAYRATTRVFEEGCAQKWVVHSDDIRPARGNSAVLDSRLDRYEER